MINLGALYDDRKRPANKNEYGGIIEIMQLWPPLVHTMGFSMIRTVRPGET